MRSLVVLIVLVSVITICCNKPGNPSDPGQPPPPPDPRLGAVTGKLLNEYNQLLSGAAVTLKGNSIIKTLIADTGTYLFSNLEAGSYNISVERSGYFDSSATISITAGDTLIKDFRLRTGTAYLNILPDSIALIKPFAGSFTIHIYSNASWLVSKTGDWFTLDKSGATGDDSTVVKFDAWTGDSARQATIQIKSGSITRNIIVKQLPEVKLLTATPLPGNSSLNIKDSIALVFNQPVTIQSIFPGNTYCQSEIKYSYAGNKVTYSYACGDLGGDYPFTITTRNSLNDQYTFNYSVGFYDKVINLTGTIQSYFVNDADNSYWIITDHPNALYKIDMNTFDILHTYNLVDLPAMFTVNPYNNDIYIAYHGIPKLYIMDQQGVTKQVLDIPHDTTRGFYEYNGPYIYPQRLVFTKTGKGMIWLGDRLYDSGVPFWFIDAADNHRIWYEQPGGDNGFAYSGKTNYDKTKIILRGSNSDPTISTFDPQQMTMKNFKPARNDIAGFIAPSRKNDYVYIGQLYFQSVANPVTGFETAAVNRDTRYAPSADFCYKPGKDLSVYYTENSSMEIIDYSTGKSPVKYGAIPLLQGTTATLDGKWVIANRHDGNYNARVIRLPASWFDY